MIYFAPILLGAFIAAEFLIIFRGFFVISQIPLFHLPIVTFILGLQLVLFPLIKNKLIRLFEKITFSSAILFAAIYTPIFAILIFHEKLILGLSFLAPMPWYCITLYPFFIFVPLTFNAASCIKHRPPVRIFLRPALLGAAFFFFIDFVLLAKLDFIYLAIAGATIGLGASALYANTTFAKIRNWVLTAIFALILSSPIPLKTNKLIMSFVREFKTEFVLKGETNYGLLTIHKKNGKNIFSINHSKFITPHKQNTQELIHNVMLQYPWAESVLLIGEWTDAIEEIMLYPSIKNIYWGSPVPEVFNIAKVLLPESLLKTEKLRILSSSDPRSFIQKIKYEEIFDVVIISIPDPTNIFYNRYYSYEFFKELSTVVSDNSMLCITLNAAQEDLSLNRKHLASVVYNTMHRFFPNSLESSGKKIQILASHNRNFTTSHLALTEFVNAIEGIPSYISPALIKYWLYSRQRARNILKNNYSEVNTDAKPVSLLYSLNEILFTFGILDLNILQYLGKIKPIAIYALISLLSLIGLKIFVKKEIETKLFILLTGACFAFAMYFYDLILLIHASSGQIFRNISLASAITTISNLSALIFIRRTNKRMYVAILRLFLMLAGIYFILLPAILELGMQPLNPISYILFLLIGGFIMGTIIFSAGASCVELNNGTFDKKLIIYILAGVLAASFSIIIMIATLGTIEFLPAIGLLCLAGVLLISI